MNVLVAGLSPRDEAAFGFFLSRSMKGWSWASTPAGRGTVLPKADLLVADLVALGLAQWSQAAEAELLRVLQGNSAVLLVPSNDQTWATMNPVTVKQHALVWLQKPYGTEDMRMALEKAAAACQQAAAPPPAAARAKPAPRSPGAVPGTATLSGGPGPAAPTARPVTPLPQARPVLPTVSFRSPASLPQVVSHDASDEVPGLSAQDLQTRLAGLPDSGRQLFLRKLAAMLMQRQPFEARFTVHNSVIFHPVDGWVASNTPMMVIERVCQSDALAAAVTVREIEGSQAEERAHRLGMPLRELDTFLWELATASLDKKSGGTAGSRLH